MGNETRMLGGGDSRRISIARHRSLTLPFEMGQQIQDKCCKGGFKHALRSLMWPHLKTEPKATRVETTAPSYSLSRTPHGTLPGLRAALAPSSLSRLTGPAA